MKKLFIVLSLGALLSGCGNMSVIDTTWNFGRGIVHLPDGTIIKGEIEAWKDYDDSDMIQVTINDVTYYTHGSNIVLISD